MNLNSIIQSSWAPNWFVRWSVRNTYRRGLHRQYGKDVERQNTQKRALLRRLRRSPIAHHTDEANIQHYEVPTQFFELVLGKRKKYSCCYWPGQVTTLEAAEEASLRLTCERARLEDGMRVLDLGCGWGSLTLWIAEHYPECEVLAISNSHSQAAYIQDQAEQAGYINVRVQTANVANLVLNETFDRVISIEMFEHMKNYEALLAKIASWLKSGGMLFVHHFSHKHFLYEFDASNPEDWMARTFFSGGTMPSDDLLLYFQRDLNIVTHWVLSGRHYAETLRAWWDRMQRNRTEIELLLADEYGPDSARERFRHWELFFMLTEETWSGPPL